MTWHVLTGEYPPECGGVGDYTAYLADALVAAGDSVHVWTPVRLKAEATRTRGSEATRADSADATGTTTRDPWVPPSGGSDLGQSGVIVHHLPDRFGRASRRELARAWRETPGIVLLQYVPNALGARGLNLPFCLWLRKVRSSGADVRIMFHEPYFYFSFARPWRNVLAIAQRTMAAVLLQAAATAYMSTDTWRRYLAAVGTLPPSTTLPIPSSIPAAPSQALTDRYRAEIAPDGAPVVGHFGTYGDHVASELLDLLPTLIARLPDARLACVGAGSVEFLARLRVRYPEVASRTWAAGRLDGAALGAVLHACDLLIQPYPDGVTTRRTSVMAGLKNGVATVSTTGFLTEPVWSDTGAVALVPVGHRGGFAETVSALLDDAAARAALARRGAQTYEARFSIEHTVATLRADPQPPGSGPRARSGSGP